MTERSVQAPPAAARPSQRPTLVLASSSRYRRTLIERLGIEFVWRSPDVDETHLPGEPACDLVVRLALAKAEAVVAELPGLDCVVIGGDQVAEIDGRILTKPGTVDSATDQLALLAGRTHRLWTALCVLRPQQCLRAQWLDRTELTMRSWTRAELRSYVQRDQPLDCAGSYRLERLGVCLFASISGADPTAIEGTPLMELTRLLGEAGVPVL